MKGNIEILDKNSLRRLVKQLKSNLTDVQKRMAADDVFAKVEQLPQFVEAKNVAAYWSLPDELPTHDFVEKWCKQKNLYLPVVVGDNLVFRKYASNADMQPGAFGIAEPCGDDLPDLQNIDVVIVPGVAFDAVKSRMGRGRGFYDRFLSQTNAYKIGVAFGCQLFDKIPTSDADIPVDEVITDNK